MATPVTIDKPVFAFRFGGGGTLITWITLPSCHAIPCTTSFRKCVGLTSNYSEISFEWLLGTSFAWHVIKFTWIHLCVCVVRCTGYQCIALQSCSKCNLEKSHETDACRHAIPNSLNKNPSHSDVIRNNTGNSMMAFGFISSSKFVPSQNFSFWSERH